MPENRRIIPIPKVLQLEFLGKKTMEIKTENGVIPIHVHISTELHRQFVRFCKKKQVSQSQAIRDAIEKYIKVTEVEVEAEE